MKADPRVVVISLAFRPEDGDATRLESKGFESIWRHDLSHVAAPADLVDALRGAWGVVAGAEHYTQAVLEASPGLRIIARPGVGVDAVDVEAATGLGVAVVTTPGANVESVADHTLALMLAGLGRLVDLDARTRAGEWRPDRLGHELSGSTVGIVGLGAIGRAVARRLAGFDCRILVVEPNPDPAFCRRYDLTVMSLAAMLPLVDVLTIHVPLVAETRGMIGSREIGLLRDHVLVVNTARGGIVDEPSLVSALREERIGRAALDVFEHEPFRKDDPLAGLPNVTLSPHQAAFTVEAVRRMVDATIENLVAVRSGIYPPGCVNRSGLEGRAATAAGEIRRLD